MISSGTFAARLERALAAGSVAAFQYRVKGLDQHEAARLAGPLQDICAAREVAFIVNDSIALAKRIGQAYVGLIEVRGLHQTLAHAYLLGSHPVIGAAARKGFATVWRFFRDEMGLDADEARAFMAEGMLISTMIGLRFVDDYGSDPQITELFRSCFPTELPHVLEMLPRGVDRF